MRATAGARRRSVLTVLLAALVALPLVLAGPWVAPAVGVPGTGQLSFTKEVTGQTGTPTYGAGDTFSYTLRIGCSSVDGPGCGDAQIDDTLPAPLTLDPDANPAVEVTGVGSAFAVSITDGNPTIRFTRSLGDGDVGLQGGDEAIVTIRVRVPPNASTADNGTKVNNARATQSNGAPRSDSADVNINIEQNLVATVDKSVDAPNGTPVTASPGEPVNWTIGGSNASNGPVDTLVIQDPADGAADSFQYLGLIGFGTFRAPTGADRVQVDWRDAAGNWNTGSPSPIPADPTSLLPADLEQIHGLRFTFSAASGSLPATAVSGGAAITYNTETRDNVSTIPANTTVTVTNRVSSKVTSDGSSSPVVQDTSTVPIRREPPTVTLEKEFGAAALTAGQSTVASLTATNGPVPVTQMVITEPDGSGDLAAQGLTFTGFTGDLEWPQGATGASIQYAYADGFTEGPRSTSTVDSLPGPATGHRVSGFTVTFTGPMPARTVATVPFSVTADRVPGPTNVTSTNTASAQVSRSDGQTSDLVRDSDDLTRRPLRVTASMQKNIARDYVYAVPGASSLVSLPAAVDDQGPNASTVGSQYLQITDPASPGSAPSDFWDHFDLAAIAPTDIPANARLTISYWDGSTWTDLPGASNVAGPVDGFEAAVPSALKSQIQGIRFTFTPKVAGDLLPPGFQVLPYFRVALRDTLRSDSSATALPADPTDFTNDAESEVRNPLAVIPTDTARDDDTIQVRPVPPGGPGTIDKGWLLPNGQPSADQATVVALTDDQRTARLAWSTQNIPMTKVVLSDPGTAPNGTPGAVQDTVFDAFDLVRIAPITDPLMTFDAISKVELYNGTSWVDITGQACPTASACDGKFPGYTLTTAQQASTQGMRLTVVESPTRASRIDGPNDPPVGSGVAASDDNGRLVDLVFQLRQQRRSNPDEAVLGVDKGPTYNTGSRGVVRNSGSLAGTTTDGSIYNGNATADISILDRETDVSLTKQFDQANLGVPQSGTDQGLFPLVTATLTATNQGAPKVRTMEIVDPTGGTDPFETLNLYDIDSISVPAGATSSTVYLTVGGTETAYTVAAALALTSAQLADVTAIRVLHTGLIDSQASSTVRLVQQLRATHRSDDSPVSAGEEVSNQARATVTNPGSTASTTDSDDVDLVQPTYGVTAGKTISPGTRAETTARTGYTVTLTGQPTGTVRTRLLTMTDARPTFWNAFDLASFSSQAVPAPVNQLRLDVLVGVTYTQQGDDLVALCGGSTDLTACWRIGTWTTTSGGRWTPTLPLGVVPAQVRGVRVLARKADQSSWERPANPQVPLTFSATRRVNLFWSPDGDNVTPVPSTRPDLDPAPGESARGTFTDDVQVHADGAWLNQADPWTADDTASATTKLTHLPNRISVSKSPGNGTNPPPQYAPDTPIPYVLTFKNTGSWPMTGLTIRDQIATNTKGSLLIWPKNDDGSPDPSYSFTLTDSAGASKPTTGFGVALNTTTGLLRVTTPAGFVLQPGDTLVVKTNLIFQTGLEPGTAVVNEVSATSDRIFDTCTNTSNNRPNGSVSNVDECASRTVVEPSALSPIRAIKSVRGIGAGLPGAAPTDANYDDLGVIQAGFGGTSSACSSPNSTNGFYRYPCIPITRPGGTERWQLSLSNQGNIPVGVLAGIDVLPAPGDTGVITSASRESKWATTLIGNFRNDAGTVDPEEKQLRLYYSTTVPSTACNAADIRNELLRNGLPTTDPCYAQVQGRPWIRITGSTSPAALASARALKAVVDYDKADDGVGLAPGSTINVSFDTTTAAYSPTAEIANRDPVAWNSFAAGSRGSFGGTDQVSSVVEPRKVGVAMSSGRFALQKKVEQPPGANFPLPTTFPFKMKCTSAGKNVPLVDENGKDVSTVQLTRDQVLTVNGGSTTSPWGEVNVPNFATCSLTELGSQGSTVSFDPSGPDEDTSGDITAVRDYSLRDDVANPAYPFPIDSQQVTATNTYRTAGFTVSKAIVPGGALDQDGRPITINDTFTFTASCLFNGVQVVPAADRTFSLQQGASKTFDGLPAGATCTVTETSSGSSSSTTHSLTQGGTEGQPVAGKTAAFTLAPDQDGEHDNSLQFTNTYTVGSVNVTKNLAGAGADAWGDRQFTARLVCSLVGAVPLQVYDDTHVLTRDANTWRVDNLPTGASCTVTETQNGGANSTTITPNNGSFTVGNGTVAQVAITNSFTLGAVKVTKRVTGDTKELPAALTGTYTVSLACTRTVNGTAVPVVIPGGAERVLDGNGDTVTYSGLPTGASCQVTETDSDPQAQSTTVSPTRVTVGASESTPVNVTVTNDFALGALRVTKSVLGAGADLYGDGPFEVTLSCTVLQGGIAQTIPIPGGAVRTLAPGRLSTTYVQLPVGARCTIEETDAAGADSTSIAVTAGGDTDVVDGTSADVVIRDDTASAPGGGTPGVVANVRNTFEVGSVQAVKKIEGDGGDFVNGPFSVRLTCTREVSGQTVPVTIPGDDVRELTREDPSTTWGPLPRRATCVVSELDDAGAASRTISPESVVVGARVQVVTVTNTFEPAGLTVSKKVDDGGAVDQDGTPIRRQETYSFTVACTLSGEELDLPAGYRAFTLERDQSKDLAGLPVGARCTVTETDNGTASTTTHVITEDASTGASQDGSRAQLTLGADTSAGDHVNAVDFTNAYTVGSVEVTKAVEGPGDAWGDKDFRIELKCTLADATPGTVYDSSTLLNVDNKVWTVDNLPDGATCKVTEDPDVDGGANETEYDPENGTVTVVGGETTPVGVFNFFGLGDVRVTKQVEGDTDELPASLTGTYTVSLDCIRRINGTEYDIEIPGGATRTITTSDNGDGTGSGTEYYRNLPTGALCQLSEVDSDPQSQETVLTPDGGSFTVNADQSDPIQVRATNTFHLGSLHVTKQVAGDGAELYGAGPFEVSLACTTQVGGKQTEVAIPGGATRTLSALNQLSASYVQLPVGAECTLTETRTGGADATNLAVTTGDQDPVRTKGTSASLVIQDDTASTGDGSPSGVEAVVDNRFDVGSVRVTKQITGPGAADVDGPFTVSIACTRTVDGTSQPVDIPGGATRTLSRSGGLVDTWAPLPAGARCAVTEPRDGGAASSTVSPAQLVVRPGAAAAVRVVNRFDPPTVSPNEGIVSPNQAGLSNTGSPVRPWMIALALACLVAGGLLVEVSRRLRRR